MEEVKKCLSPYKGRLLKATLAVAVVALFGVVRPLIFGILFDKAAVWGNQYILAGIAIVAAMGLIKIYLTGYIFKQKTKVGIRCQADWIVKLTDRVTRLPVGVHGKDKTGETMDQINKSGFYIGFTLSEVYFAVLTDVISIVVMFMFLLKMNYGFSLVIVAVVVIYMAITIKMSGPLNEAEKDARRKDVEQSGLQEDIAVNTEAIKAARLEKTVNEKYRGLYGIFVDSVDFLADKIEGASFWQRSILEIGFVATLGLAIFSSKDASLTKGSLVIIVSYAGMIFGPLGSFSQYQAQIRRAKVNIEDGISILKKEPEPYGVGLTASNGNSNEIAIRNLWVSYKDKNGGIKEALKGVNMTIDHGQKITAVVGPSGSGKTTLMKALGRYPDSDMVQGKILFGGEDINSYEICFLRETITFVGRLDLFNDTIEQNIRYGNPDATREEIIEAAWEAGLFSSIENSEASLKRMVGPKEMNISAGEKQKIIIARGLVNKKKAKVLIFDEPTLGLDADSVRWLKETFKRLSETKKVIIITHDIIEIASMSEFVYVMDNGLMVEQGTPEELLGLGKIYAGFYREQMPKIESRQI